MQDFLEIEGGYQLSGTVRVSGAKNAALPLIVATLLTPEQCVLHNVPNLSDISILQHLLNHFGAETEFHGSSLSIRAPALRATEASYSLVKALRASFWVLAPLLARGRAARVSLPGGDIIGARPVDIHLAALQQMGADIQIKHGVVLASAPRGLKPANLEFRFPSVGATHQILMAAALTPGTTVLKGAAREPEVVALADFITAMGATVEGAGTSELVIHGVEELGGAELTIIGDRIEAGTYIVAGLITGGEVTVEGLNPEHLGGFLGILENLGVSFQCTDSSIAVRALNELRAVEVETQPFPGFATDLQALLMALLTVVPGTSKVEECIYEGRFGHVAELCRMGAKISVTGRSALIEGVPVLSGAPVEAHDLRAGAALALAGLKARGITRIQEPQHIWRGYERFDEKLRRLGAKVSYKSDGIEDILFAGC